MQSETGWTVSQRSVRARENADAGAMHGRDLCQSLLEHRATDGVRVRRHVIRHSKHVQDETAQRVREVARERVARQGPIWPLGDLVRRREGRRNPCLVAYELRVQWREVARGTAANGRLHGEARP